jgi:hypothetical protein
MRVFGKNPKKLQGLEIVTTMEQRNIRSPMQNTTTSGEDPKPKWTTLQPR